VGLLEQIRNLQQTAAQVQDAIGELVSTFEKIQNVFNWTDPYISTLAVSAVCLGAVFLSAVVVLVGSRYVAIFIGIAIMPPKPRYFQGNSQIMDGPPEWLVMRAPDLHDLQRRAWARNHTTIVDGDDKAFQPP